MCERSLHTIDMSKLMNSNTSKGLHNREYFFTFVVTNNAFLRTVDHVDILVDESVPVKGIVREGASGENDIDFTQDNKTFISWNGFIDHESGINLYRIALSPWCLGYEEMVNSLENDSIVSVNTSENSVLMYFPREGMFITSVVAFNNAGEPSDVACSDGIMYDTSPIEIFNLTGSMIRTEEGIACYDNQTPFLIMNNLSRVRLVKSSKCAEICRNFTFETFINTLPEISRNHSDSSISEGICGKLSPFVGHEIYIPSDKIQVSWERGSGHSQIDDFYVGFGQSSSEYLSPSLISYQRTSGHSRYLNHHSGLRSAKSFWMYIKSLSKTGVEKTIPIGPIIIDSTPVKIVKDLLVESKDNSIYIGWENETFIDEEEIEPVSSIYFRFGK